MVLVEGGVVSARGVATLAQLVGLGPEMVVWLLAISSTVLQTAAAMAHPIAEVEAEEGAFTDQMMPWSFTSVAAEQVALGL